MRFFFRFEIERLVARSKLVSCRAPALYDTDAALPRGRAP